MNESEFNQWIKELPEEKWRVNTGLSAGHIHRNTTFGDCIYDIASDLQYKNYVEIGTMCGRGTTKCFLDGIIPREDNAFLHSLESNHKFYLITKNYWSKYFQYKKINLQKFKLTYGSIISFNQLKSHEEYNYVNDLKKAPVIKINEPIEVLCIDGGKYDGILEWNMFKHQIKVIILDDTDTPKTREIVKEINTNKEWEIICDTDDRNGELIARKK